MRCDGPERCDGLGDLAARVRTKKGHYSKALLIWDHHGSGRDHKYTAIESALAAQNKLDASTWKDNSTAIVLVPELEQWRWFCTSAVVAYYRLSPEQVQAWMDERASACGTSVTRLQADNPKDLFEYIVRNKLKRTLSPRDFGEIGRRASIKALYSCASFCAVVDALRGWFPPPVDLLEVGG